MAGDAIEVVINGLPELVSRFAAMNGQLMVALNRGMLKAGYIIEAAAKQNVRTVLHVRSGRLMSSIQAAAPIVSGDVVEEHIGAGGTNVVYARIHERGGTIPAHTVYPRNAKALHFVTGGQSVFARRANIPEIHMPARPYLRPAAEENIERIRQVITQEIQQAIRGTP